MAKRCGGGKSRHEVLQQTDERGFETKRSAQCNRNPAFQGKVWKPDVGNGWSSGLHWLPRGWATQPSCRHCSHLSLGLATSPWAVGTQTPTPQGMGTPWGAFRVCRWDVLFVVGEAHAIQISHSFLNSSPHCSSNQTKSPDSSKNFTSEKGALPETMNPCRDFTFAIDFMREMLSDSDNIWQYKKPERE